MFILYYIINQYNLEIIFQHQLKFCSGNNYTLNQFGNEIKHITLNKIIQIVELVYFFLQVSAKNFRNVQLL